MKKNPNDIFNDINKLIIPFAEITNDKEIKIPKSLKPIQNLKKILTIELSRIKNSYKVNVE
ncbi:MAG: hypothetical protein KGD63_06805 [Candidatus Lokiarchaeota archaeon]|nr:hypothetical protein [Candidatus Lokiarchaeota archaeon]